MELLYVEDVAKVFKSFDISAEHGVMSPYRVEFGVGYGYADGAFFRRVDRGKDSLVGKLLYHTFEFASVERAKE